MLTPLVPWLDWATVRGTSIRSGASAATDASMGAMDPGPSVGINFCPRCGTAVQPQFRYGKVRLACPVCSFVHFANPKVAVVVFLTDGDRILLVKRGVEPEKGQWALAAGFVDLGESPEAAAVREMREETGLDVVIQGLMEVSYDPARQVIVILYRAQWVGGILAADDDVEDARWFTGDSLPELAFESTHRAVKGWMAS